MARAQRKKCNTLKKKDVTSRTREVVAHGACQRIRRWGNELSWRSRRRGQIEGTRGKRLRTVCHRERGAKAREGGCRQGGRRPEVSSRTADQGSKRASERASRQNRQAGKKSARVARVSYTGATRTQWWGWARAAGLQLPLCIAPFSPLARCRLIPAPATVPAHPLRPKHRASGAAAIHPSDSVGRGHNPSLLLGRAGNRRDHNYK